jgi:hypothetical protein
MPVGAHQSWRVTGPIIVAWLRDLLDYCVALAKHWKAFLTGSTATAVVFVLFGTVADFRLPSKEFIAIFVFLGLLAASFAAWRDLAVIAKSIRAPMTRIPRFEITNAAVAASPRYEALQRPTRKVMATQIQATFRLYITPTERTVIRKRLSTATITSRGTETNIAFHLSVTSDPPHPVFASGPDIIADGPGAFDLVFVGEVPGELPPAERIKASTTIHIVDAPLIQLTAELVWEEDNRRWWYGRDI